MYQTLSEEFIQICKRQKVYFILSKQMESSKSIYNKALYCQRTWFSRIHSKIIAYYADNFELYLNDFSTRDKLYLFHYFVYTNDIDKLNTLLSRVERSEYNSFQEARNTAVSILQTDQLVEIDNTINDRNIDYSFDFQSIIDVIDKD